MQRSLYDVMGDPKLAPIVSGEGPIPLTRELVAQLGASETAPGHDANVERAPPRA